MKTAVAQPQEVEGKIIPLLAEAKPKRGKPEVKSRFRVIPYKNPRTGSTSWCVTGMKRNRERIRKNFSEQEAAEVYQNELNLEWLKGEARTEIKATRLSEDQIKLAESAFVQLGTDKDSELPLAIQFWIQNGRPNAVQTVVHLDDAESQFNEWLKKTESLRDRTKANLRLRVSVFRKSVGNLRIPDIQPETIEDYLKGRDVSPSSKDNDRRALSRFFSWCMERPRRWAQTNPCREVEIEQDADTDQPSILSVSESERLLRAAEAHKGGRLVPYVSVCIFGGLRPFEAQRLTWSKVNLKDREMRLEASMTKTKEPRVVVICDTLAAWLGQHDGKAFYPVNWRKDFDLIKAEAGFGNNDRLPRRFRDTKLTPWPDDVMRHTAISHYFRKTGSFGQTAEQFGNSEAIIKRHYKARVSSDETKAFYAIMPKKGSL